MKPLDDGPGVNEVFQTSKARMASRLPGSISSVMDSISPDQTRSRYRLATSAAETFNSDAGRPPAKTLVFQVL